MAFWDTGRISIPPIVINLFNQDSTLESIISTDTLFIDVVSITDARPNLKNINSGNIISIKEPVPLKNRLSIKIAFLIVLLLALLIGFFFIWRKRIDPKTNNKSNALYESPNTIALQKLDLLKNNNLNDQNEKKDFYAKISYILREYVEASLFIRTLEMTTEEINRYEFIFPYNQNQFKIFSDILSKCDMIKYARLKSTKKQCKDLLTSSSLFIKKAVG